MASNSNGVESTTWAPDPKRSRWGNLLLCYFVFFLALASQFSICLATTSHQNFDNPRVKRQAKTSPGLEFRPLPPDARSTLITYKGYSSESYKYWEDQLNEFLSEYKKPTTAAAGQNIVNCDFERPPPPGMFCDVDIRTFEPCSEENHFSYHRSSPCIFLKLDKLYGWRPEFYNDTSALPEDMPQDLQSQIKNIVGSNRIYENMVWVSCQGETPADKEFIGPIKYLPYPGFPGYFFPYNNAEGYLSPLVAVHFERPKTGIVINIECRAWARNIQYNTNEHLGAVHFELMID